MGGNRGRRPGQPWNFTIWGLEKGRGFGSFSFERVNLEEKEETMTNVLDFFIRLKTIKRGGAGLPPRGMRDAILAEHMGPAMHAKLYLVHRARRKRGGLL